ncbi:acetyl/propionyl/methylcrotonyl-CoA carboxylase subunit alpha [Nocardioides kongjuensis]|uniref:Acetyl-CoA carboxylase biotin carboxylase subunit n=1 Tax=Nocardioides kongjuensis TaxID=349522 RepID=A0A852RUD8_9ACTN|nr:biotin carboxylase N-terminal domain-containing protein [Nocardioides kongjuensis]NYD32836.1 acetyl-CoA carboxylase biotin carboxylase subunit [Nocardioides kongjuensis]
MTNPLPQRVLVANRGEIARRVIATCRRLGVGSVAVHHAVDAGLPFVAEADIAHEITGDVPVKAYLDGAQLIEVARSTGATAIHPGYGFLAENADFAQQVTDAGLTWIGPTPESIRTMGDKVESRRVVAAHGVPVSGGADDALASVEEAVTEAARIGYPVIVKASGGGGGIGMAVAHDEEQLRKAFESTRSMAERSFGSDRVFVERFVSTARHIEVQVLGRADGSIVALGERDCSVQRRHQKLVEECPAPHLSDDVRRRLHESAVLAAGSVGYLNAGTVEFLLDTVTEDFVFLEMNTRIQVEHPVTELTHGVDLVEQQLSIAQTGTTTADFAPALKGHAIELRICAEDPKRFFPSPGDIDVWEPPTGPDIRLDAGYAQGTTVTPYFDPMIAKLCVHADTREQAVERARAAAAAFEIGPLTTNLPFLVELLDSAEFSAGRYDTNIVANIKSK